MKPKVRSLNVGGRLFQQLRSVCQVPSWGTVVTCFFTSSSSSLSSSSSSSFITSTLHCFSLPPSRSRIRLRIDGIQRCMMGSRESESSTSFSSSSSSASSSSSDGRPNAMTKKSVEAIIEQRLSEGDLRQATEIFMQARENQIEEIGSPPPPLSNIICHNLLTHLVNHCHWRAASACASYMLENNYRFQGRELFFITGGLIGDPNGAEQVLNLLKLIVEKRRDDLVRLFSYRQLNKFSNSAGESFAPSAKVPIEALSRAMKSTLLALEHDGWYSFSISKMLIAMACAGMGHSLALDYMVRTVQLLKNGNIVSDELRQVDGKVDLLSVMINFSQGAIAGDYDRRVSAKSRSITSLRSEKGLKAFVSVDLCSTILQMVVMDMPAAGLLDGPRQSADLFKMYWVLSYCVRMTCFYPPHLVDVSLPKMRSSNSGSSSSNNHHHHYNSSELSANQVNNVIDPNISISSTSSSGKGVKDAMMANVVDMNLAVATALRKNAAVQRDRIRKAPPRLREAQDARGDYAMKECYRQLMTLLSDEQLSVAEFSPPPGYHRRVFRVLCDELGLRHKVIESSESKKDAGNVRVWKVSRGNLTPPPSLEELVRRDALRGEDRKFDLAPPMWDIVETHLSSLPTRSLGMTALNVTLAFIDSYASPSWGLQWLEVVKGNGLHLSRGILRNVLGMCASRRDIYSMLEVLYLAKIEDTNAKNAKRRVREAVDGSEYREMDLPMKPSFAALDHSAARRAGADGRSGGDASSGVGGGIGGVGGGIISWGSMDGFERRDEAAGDDADAGDGLLGRRGLDPVSTATSPPSKREDRTPEHDDGAFEMRLRSRDWNKACLSAWHCRVADMPQESFKEAFTEVMGLMRASGMLIDHGTSRTLLRFMVFAQPQAEMTWKLVRRLYRDRLYPMCHIECVALTSMLIKRLRSSHLPTVYVLSKPVYKWEDYLTVYPNALTVIVDAVSRQSEHLSPDFNAGLEMHLKEVFSPEGREALYGLVLRLVSAQGQRAELIDLPSREVRDAVTLLVTYIAYLVSANDGRYRRAYDLLYAMESLNREAQELAQKREAEEKAADFESGGRRRGNGQGRYYGDDSGEDEEDYEQDYPRAGAVSPSNENNTNRSRWD